MAKKFYLTSAIPYVNAAPHIGHAQEFVYSDVIKRFHKLMNESVLYLCGADENALKIFQAAEKAGETPQKFTDFHNKEFLHLANKLNIQFDVWQRGSDEEKHFSSSQKLWNLCVKNGDIYKKSYSGLYCVGCEMFYTEEELDKNGECFEHPGRKLDRVAEENYFFKLSKYQDFLEDLITTEKLKITPEIRRNEALSFIKKELPDFSVSRSKKRARGWGIPVPGDSDQIMYVWFDALNIYQTGIGFGSDEKTYKKWAPQDVMVIGKGITRFHAIYWPAILKSAGLALPKQLFVHGYLTVDGQKMSKTVGNVIDPISLIEKYGTDALRYYLLREIPSYGDGDFSERRFKEVYNADLANNIGNLVSRVSRLATNNSLNLTELKPKKQVKVFDEIKPFLDNFQFDKALEHVVGLVTGLNQYIDKQQPWKQSKSEAVKTLKTIIGGSASLPSLLEIAYSLQPFLPETAEKILHQFSGTEIKSQPPLFPRIS
jgi:methionyl-tRNA synthetase